MVIQRWQSILLLVVAVVMGCFTFCNLAEVNYSDQTLSFSTLGFKIDEGPSVDDPNYLLRTWPLFTLALLSMILPAINIFLFKNMKLQKTLCLIELLFLLVVVVMCGIYGYYYIAAANDVSYTSVIIVAPLLAFVADIMTYNRISHDQRLLKAADRLR